MATKKQIMANQANAQKSIGPKTAEGRKVASRNAATHPLCQGSCRMDFKVNENQKWAMNRKEHDVSDRTEGSGHREDASAA